MPLVYRLKYVFGNLDFFFFLNDDDDDDPFFFFKKNEAWPNAPSLHIDA